MLAPEPVLRLIHEEITPVDGENEDAQQRDGADDGQGRRQPAGLAARARFGREGHGHGGEGGGSARPLAVDEPEIAGIDEDAHGLAENEDGVAALDGIGKQHGAADHRKIPEGDGHDGFARLFRRQPLHEKAAGEHQLGQEAEGDPEEFAARGHVQPGHQRLHHRACSCWLDG